MTPRRRIGRTSLAVAALLAISTLTTIASPATAEPEAPAVSPGLTPDDVRTLGDPVHGLEDKDTRATVAPTALQRASVAALGPTILRWNDLGSPASILPEDRTLGAAPGAPAAGARAWLAQHAAVFGLTASDVADLELVNEQALAGIAARAVLFRQRYGGLVPADGGLVTVGVADEEVAYVSSSLTRADAAPPAATLSPLEGWLKAAADVRPGTKSAGIEVLGRATALGDWTRLQVPGLAQEQQVRLRALATGADTVRPVYEANVVDMPEGGHAHASTVVVDAVTGDVLLRRNQVDNAAYNDVFTGTFTATACGPVHSFELEDDLTRQINAVAVAAPVDDITIKITGPGGLNESYDLLTSPETASYNAPEPLPAGTYGVQICPFDAASAVIGSYTVAVSTNDSGTPTTGGGLGNPRWRYFPANPTLDSDTEVPSNSVIGCWVQETGCTLPSGELQNVASPAPWDALRNGVPTFTTTGNNAHTREAWLSPLTPGGFMQAPESPTREYTTEFTDAWNNSRCAPFELTPDGGNDIDFSVGNLFVSHNRMHDYSYYLGFTEENYNMQVENGGNGGVPGDPEIGNAQAGAVGGLQSGLGRDNANQITLQDGVPGITNQYLFQPIAGAFYAPCTDGGLDMGIVGHEYTHAISNRMVGGPDTGLTSEHGGAMGESWSDLVAGEYQFSHGYSNGGNIWAIGAYATGNLDTAIRDYAVNKNPLNFSNYGFDTTGPEVHADGEIWNGTMWEVRQALVDAYDGGYDYDDAQLQLACAQATRNETPLRAQSCPGNRRWVQLMFDSFLLQQGSTSMLTARDAFIAADQMRFGGANRDRIWEAFARRGMGRDAAVVNGEDHEPTPSFASPVTANQRITFVAPADTRVYVGDYEARVTPVADTAGATERTDTADFTPGRYRMLAVSPSNGFVRFTLDVQPGGGNRTVTLPDNGTNLAAAAAGATVIPAGTTAGSLNADFLIDGTELTNWGGVGAAETSVDDTKPSVAVDLAGGTHTVRRVSVSAMLNPAPATDDPVPVLAGEVDENPNSGSRFTALRQFALQACTTACDTADAVWSTFYTSPADAFPGVQPRPVAPNLTMRSFDVPDTEAAAVRLVTLQNQCTGGEDYAGEQDDDPTNATDCTEGSDRDQFVNAAELQVFATNAPTPGTGTGPEQVDPTGTTTLPTGPGANPPATTPTTAAAARTRIRMIVKRAFQTKQKPAPVLFLTVRSAVEKEAGKFVVRINKKKYKVVTTADGTARIKVRKGRLRPGRNTVRVRFVPRDATAFTPSKTRLRRITVERRR
jgi:extracellular elastinolytic metalloproteinase